LILCLERRAADPTTLDSQSVTTRSLRVALEAAYRRLSEIENKPIQFATIGLDSTTFTAELCQVRNPLEVFVKIHCSPLNTMNAAQLYIQSEDMRICRPAPLAREWYTTATCGDWSAGADFDAQHRLITQPQNFRPTPPLCTVRLLPTPHPD